MCANSQDCLKKVTESLYTSKIRYGLQLCGSVRTTSAETESGLMKDLQKTQNKALRFLNNSRLKDKISTKSILDKMKMLSVNQLNGQIKLTETWKFMNNKNSSLKNLVLKSRDSERVTRIISIGKLVEEGYSNLSHIRMMQQDFGTKQQTILKTVQV